MPPIPRIPRSDVVAHPVAVSYHVGRRARDERVTGVLSDAIKPLVALGSDAEVETGSCGTGHGPTSYVAHAGRSAAGTLAECRRRRSTCSARDRAIARRVSGSCALPGVPASSKDSRTATAAASRATFTGLR
jgi:hypothetical protein